MLGYLCWESTEASFLVMEFNKLIGICGCVEKDRLAKLFWNTST